MAGAIITDTTAGVSDIKLSTSPGIKTFDILLKWQYRSVFKLVSK